MPAQCRRIRARTGQTMIMYGMRVRFHCVGADTRRRLGMWEFSVPPRYQGPPLHCHSRTLEIFWMLRGKLRFTVGGSQKTVSKGGCVVALPGVAHSFRNRTLAPATMLVARLPAGFEGYFEQLFAYSRTHPQWNRQAQIAAGRMVRRYDEQFACQCRSRKVMALRETVSAL